MKIKKIFFFFSFFTFGLVSTLNAKDRFINNMFFTYENDSVYSRADHWYTNGANLFLSTKDFDVNDYGYHNYSFGFGQKIYSPDDIEAIVPNPKDRPYAGYLYFFLNKNIKHGNIMDTFGANLGFTGKMSLGEQIQSNVHKLISSPTPKGWEYQVPNEVLFTISWTRIIELRNPKAHAFDWNLLPKISADLGTPNTNVGAGLEFRYGWNLEQDFLANRIISATPGVSRNSGNLSYYFFFEVYGKGIFYDTFLDNSKIKKYDSDIDREWLVYDVAFGLNLRYKDYYVKYSNFYLSEEFKQQNEGQFIFSLTFGYLF